MNSEEIEKIIRAAHKKLVKKFLEDIRNKGVSDYLKFCYSTFSTDYDHLKYRFAVHLNLTTKEDQNRYWEETESGRRLIERNPKTGEESVVISISYQSVDIYTSQLDFDLSKEVEIMNPLDAVTLKKKPSLLKKLFSGGPKQLYVENKQWKEEFLLNS